MKVFVAGATGAIGRRLVPKLIEKGYEVCGTVRSAAGAAWLRARGATPVPLDLLEPGPVRDAVRACRADAIIHEATALSGVGARSFSNPDRTMRGTNQLRTKGTDALLTAARDAGVPRFIAQSYTGWPNERAGGPVKAEADPLDPDPLPKTRRTLAAIQYLERKVVEAGGLALRYGWLYGAPDDPLAKAVRRRRFPLIGEGSGVWSFIHYDDAAEATVLALERGDAGVYNVVDDDPAPARVWLPTLAAMIGAPPPRHLPRVVARVLAGDAPVMLMTEVRGASNEKAKRELGWMLRFPSWRVGFAASYGGKAVDRSGRFVRPDIGGAHV